MRLPKSISPSPLFSTTVEIRFSSSITREELLQKMVPAFIKDLPKIETGKIPYEIKDNDETHRFAADYILKNNVFSLAFGIRSLSFEHVTEYTSWLEYFSFMNESLGKVFEMNFIEEIDRVGVRYGSILDGEYDTNKVFTIIPMLSLSTMKSDFQGFQGTFQTDISTLFLQISRNAKLVKDGITKTGIYIDIDASNTDEKSPSKKIFNIIEQLHNDQKTLFFSLLKDEYIQTLNPTY